MNLKKQKSKRLANVTMKLVYLTGKKFQHGVGLYEQAIESALKLVGASGYTGNPRTFIKTHLDVLEQHVKQHAKEVIEIKKNRQAAVKAPKPIKVSTSSAVVKVNGIDVATPEFLLSFEWRKLRMEALKKYGPKCMCCGATPAHGAVMNVDHIKPRKEYPELALVLNNLQILCHPCNHGKGNWDKTDWRPK